MLLINVDGEKYQVVFERKDVVRLDREGLEQVVQIEATIYDNHLGYVASGVSIKSELDEDKDYKGMKLALRRALDEWGVDTNVRKSFLNLFKRSIQMEVGRQHWESELQQVLGTPLSPESSTRQ